MTNEELEADIERTENTIMKTLDIIGVNTEQFDGDEAFDITVIVCRVLSEMAKGILPENVTAHDCQKDD